MLLDNTTVDTAVNTVRYLFNSGTLGVNGTAAFGNVLRVDSIYGNDSTATIGGTPYKTVNKAITDSAAATSTVPLTVWVMPGVYELTSGITLPPYVCLRGMNTQTTTIQMTSVTSDTTLITMGSPSRVEDLNLLLTSSGHYTLKGIIFGGTTTTDAKIRTSTLTLNNSGASSSGTSNVYGIECTGTGTIGPNSFVSNATRGSTISVYSNGGGNKRGILISNSNVVTLRDTNVYVAAPTNTTSSTGSYVGVETNDPGNTGSIQLHTSSI